MTTKKGKLIDLFKTPSKIKKPQYSTLDNSLKVKAKLDNETTNIMIVLYCFIFLFALVFFMTIIYTDDVSKYSYKGTNEKYTWWESIKMRLFGVPKHQPPANCYIVPSQKKCEVIEEEENISSSMNSSCINSEGKSCHQINEEWSKGMLVDNNNTDNTTDNTTNNNTTDNTTNNNSANENNEKCKTVSYPHNIEMDAVNQCLKQ